MRHQKPGILVAGFLVGLLSVVSASTQAEAP
jgi:hypothetical protein